MPLKGGENVALDSVEQRELLRFHRQLLSYHQTAEWGMRTIQGSFGRLRVPLNISNPSQRQQLLKTVVRLANLQSTMVGISQIRNVYMPIWKASEDDELWDNIGNLLIGDVRRWDRVSCFHLTIVNTTHD
jgi:hypothetical protein